MRLLLGLLLWGTFLLRTLLLGPLLRFLLSTLLL
jgi:hypothetical protein